MLAMVDLQDFSDEDGLEGVGRVLQGRELKFGKVHIHFYKSFFLRLKAGEVASGCLFWVVGEKVDSY